MMPRFRTFKLALYHETPYGARLGRVPGIRGVNIDTIKLHRVIVSDRMDLLALNHDVEDELFFNSPLPYFCCGPFSYSWSVSLTRVVVVWVSIDRRCKKYSDILVEENCWRSPAVHSKIASNSEVEETGPSVWIAFDILCGLELMCDPPLPAEGGQ